MNGITKGLAAKAVEDYKVSEQNHEVWEAGYIAGFIEGRVRAYMVVSESCAELVASLKLQIESEITDK